MGIFETATEGTESRRAGAAGLPDEGQLPARVRARADCGRLSGRRLVSLRDGRFVRRANPYPREVIRAPGEELWIRSFVRFEQDGKKFLAAASSVSNSPSGGLAVTNLFDIVFSP